MTDFPTVDEAHEAAIQALTGVVLYTDRGSRIPISFVDAALIVNALEPLIAAHTARMTELVKEELEAVDDR